MAGRNHIYEHMKTSQLLLFILVCCCCTHFVTSQRTIIQHPQNQSICEGGTVRFECVIMFPEGSSLGRGVWVDEDSNTIIEQPPNLTITDDSSGLSAPANVTNVLTITNVSISDNETVYFCGQGSGPSSVISDPSILTVLAPPMTPLNITGTTPLSSTSFTVSWIITDPTHNYIITWTNLRTGMISSMTVPENTNSYTVTGLNGIDNYIVTITANNSCGMMMSGPPITVYDAPNAAPMNIRFPEDDITSESFVVQWNEVDDIFPVTYTVRWYGVDGIDNTTTVNEPMYTVTGLTANTSYNVTVVAINTCCGAGPVSNVTMVMTNNEPTTPPPTTSTMSSSTPTSGPSDDEGEDDNIGPIVGGVVGGIVAVILVVIIIVVIYIFFCRSKKSTNSDKQELRSPTGTSGSHTASIKPASNVPHQTAVSGEEYAVTTKPTSTTTKPQQPAEEYAVVDKSKKHAATTQGIHYADLQELPGAGSKPPTNQGPTSTYAMVA